MEELRYESEEEMVQSTFEKSQYKKDMDFISILKVLPDLVPSAEFNQFIEEILSVVTENDFKFPELTARISNSPKLSKRYPVYYKRFSFNVENLLKIKESLHSDYENYQDNIKKVRKILLILALNRYFTENFAEYVRDKICETSWYQSNLVQADVFEILNEVSRDFQFSLGLFGSFARGDNDMTSDVDIVIFAKNKNKEKYFETLLRALKAVLHSRLGRPVQLVLQSRANNKILSVIYEDMIVFGPPHHMEIKTKDFFFGYNK
ncbi:nucleotidyltransferase domain-containing protein [Paenibacillus pabuli]|uniref:nucleotidyltransferase family protein n=1 Tax=Paenibacillus pabuli TaxID=1472 RepID=UPI0032423929